MNKTFNKKTKKLYYWLFDNLKDKPEIKTYINYNVNESQNNINIMIEEIYKNYIKLVYKNINNNINNVEEFTLWSFYNLIKKYTKNYFDFKLNQEIKNKLIEKILIKKIPELEIINDDIDSIIPGRNNKIIKLPILKLKKNTKNIIELGVE